MPNEDPEPEQAFNRTTLELKWAGHLYDVLWREAFNRTTLELKSAVW